MLYVLTAVISVYGQSITFDKVDANGVRRVETSMRKFSHWTSDNDVKIGLEAKDRYGEMSYRLCIEFNCKDKIRIDNYMRLLLKSKKGTVMELKCSQGCKDATGELYDPASETRIYDAKVYYDIDKGQIDCIRQEGLSRMRAEMYDRDINVKFSNSRDAGYYIILAYDVVNKRIDKRRSFSDGF